MKKALIAILVVVYLCISSGIVVNFHYCMGKLSSVEYGYNNHDQCGDCGMEKEDGCCNTEFKVIKLQDTHQWAKSGLLVNKAFYLFHGCHSPTVFAAVIPIASTRPVYKSLPDQRINSVYLHTGVFRI